MDREGKVAGFTVKPCNAAEVKELLPLVDSAPMPVGQVIADRAYDSRAIRDTLSGMGIVPVIPSRKSVKRPVPYSDRLYKSRHLVENAFTDLKQFRGIATRYCKLVVTYRSMLSLACWVVNTRTTRRGASPHS